MRLSPLDRSILSIALPSIISNITVPLLGMVDVAITGHMGDVAASSSLPASFYVSAIAVGGMLFNVMYWLFGFLRMSTSGETAQAFGRKDECSQFFILIKALLLAALFSVALLLLSPMVRDLALWYISPEAEVATLARTYFNICIWGALPSLGLFVLNGWYIGMQNSRIPMYVAIGQNVLNILASLSLVYIFRMRIEGVAYGTLLAQWMAFLAAILFFVKRYRPIWSSQRHSLPSLGVLLRQTLSFNTTNRQHLSLFLRTLCLIVVHFMFIAAGAAQGSVELAVNTLLMQFFTIYSYFMDGFAYAGEALVGKSIGAGDRAECQLMVKRLFLWGGAVALLFVVMYLFGGDLFMSALTDDVQVLQRISTYLPWTLLLPLCGMASFMWDGIYIGATAVRQMLISMAISMLVFLLGYYTLVPLYANHGLWLSFLAYLSCRGLMQTIMRRNIFP